MEINYFNRYQRQIQLQAIGIEGQQKLTNARVLIVGMGGLGCPAVQYLAGAGIGKMGLVDGDNVEIHNLHRQVLYATSDVGQNKAIVAKKKLRALNPDISINAFDEMITPQNVFDIANEYDYIIDGSDRFETRYLLDQYCSVEQKFYIYGSVYEFEGQVALFDFKSNGISYNSLFPNPPKQSAIPTCNENGILGFLPSIIGSMQALETVKHICNLKENNAFELIHYNGLTQEIYKTSAQPNANFKPPQNRETILSFDYNVICK